MSIVGDFMSKVIDLNEKEKEETVLSLAEALINDNYEFLKKISPKVQNIVLTFLTSINIKENKSRIFKCKVCKTEFYVPYNVYEVNCPCGASGHSEEIKKENEHFYEATTKAPHLKKVYFKKRGKKDGKKYSSFHLPRCVSCGKVIDSQHPDTKEKWKYFKIGNRGYYSCVECEKLKKIKEKGGEKDGTSTRLKDN